MQTAKVVPKTAPASKSAEPHNLYRGTNKAGVHKLEIAGHLFDGYGELRRSKSEQASKGFLIKPADGVPKNYVVVFCIGAISIASLAPCWRKKRGPTSSNAVRAPPRQPVSRPPRSPLLLSSPKRRRPLRRPLVSIWPSPRKCNASVKPRRPAWTRTSAWSSWSVF